MPSIEQGNGIVEGVIESHYARLIENMASAPLSVAPITTTPGGGCEAGKLG
nr:hypothetical protein [Candidatus Sigynarchaeota archaeon]